MDFRKWKILSNRLNEELHWPLNSARLVNDDSIESDESGLYIRLKARGSRSANVTRALTPASAVAIFRRSCWSPAIFGRPSVLEEVPSSPLLFAVKFPNRIVRPLCSSSFVCFVHTILEDRTSQLRRGDVCAPCSSWLFFLLWQWMHFGLSVFPSCYSWLWLKM